MAGPGLARPRVRAELDGSEGRLGQSLGRAGGVFVLQIPGHLARGGRR